MFRIITFAELHLHQCNAESPQRLRDVALLSRAVESGATLCGSAIGADGFRDAVHTLEALEAELNLENLAAFTAPPPPH